jgi:hypothetical protein
MSISPQFAKATILLLSTDDGGTVPLAEGFRGMIRVQDIRATEKDKVTCRLSSAHAMFSCFHGGRWTTASDGKRRLAKLTRSGDELTAGCRVRVLPTRGYCISSSDLPW